MQTWESYFGTVAQIGSEVSVTGTREQLFAWAHRPGQSWPAATLTDYDRVSATLAPNGDLVDLYADAKPDHDLDDLTGADIDGNELTAWIDDNLAGTPWAHLARNPEAV